MTAIKVNVKIGEIEKHFLIEKHHIDFQSKKKHFSIKQTYKNFREKYSWQCMHKDIRDFVYSCDCHATSFENLDIMRGLDNPMNSEPIDNENHSAVQSVVFEELIDEETVSTERLSEQASTTKVLPAKRRKIQRITCFCC